MLFYLHPLQNAQSVNDFSTAERSIAQQISSADSYQVELHGDVQASLILIYKYYAKKSSPAADLPLIKKRLSANTDPVGMGYDHFLPDACPCRSCRKIKFAEDCEPGSHLVGEHPFISGLKILYCPFYHYASFWMLQDCMRLHGADRKLFFNMCYMGHI